MAVRKNSFTPKFTQEYKFSIFLFNFSNVNVFMLSYYEPGFIEKFLWESRFFLKKFWRKSLWSKINENEIKIGHLAAILKRYNILMFFCLFVCLVFFLQNYDFFSAYVHQIWVIEQGNCNVIVVTECSK